jgi:hypothetical protein
MAVTKFEVRQLSWLNQATKSGSSYAYYMTMHETKSKITLQNIHILTLELTFAATLWCCNTTRARHSEVHGFEAWC